MSQDTDTVKKNYIEKKKKLICEYYKELSKYGNINRAKNAIEEFKKQLLTNTKIIEGKITALNNAISKTKFTDDLEKKNKKFKKVAGKVLSGTQLKRDVYEENTNLTIHLLYYILGMGFMGYYIIKLLKK
jgi:hypothetical protein